jgi:hypothetical protein
MNLIKTSTCGTLKIQEFKGAFSVAYQGKWGWTIVADCETLAQAKREFKSLGGK